MDVQAKREETYKSAWQDLTLAARRAYARGLQTGSGGNLSVRLPGCPAMMVKSSGGSFADCGEDGRGWTPVGLDGLPMGTDTPTREWRLHAALLRELETASGIVHCHAPWTVAWAESHEELPQATWHCKLKFNCAIPVIHIPAAVVPEEQMDRILSRFRENPALPAFILRGHGLVTVGKSAVEAEHIAEMVEETAQICVLQTLLRSASEKERVENRAI